MKLPKKKRDYLMAHGYTEDQILALEDALDEELEEKKAVIMKLKNGEFMRVEKDEFDILSAVFSRKKSLLLKSLLGEKK